MDTLMQDFISSISAQYSLDTTQLNALLEKTVKSQKATPGKATPEKTHSPSSAMKPSAELSKMTKVELAEHCKLRGLKTTGTKADLIERLTGGATASASATTTRKKTTPTKEAKEPAAKPKAKATEQKSGLPPSLKEMIKPISYRITKNEFGNFYHSETGLVYDRDLKKFVGKQHQNGRVDQLTDADIEVCHRYNFPYILPENLAKSETKVVVSELDDDLGEGEGDEEEIEEEDVDEAGDDGADDLDGLDADE